MDLTTFDAVLLDLDGTIWHEHAPLPGAVDLVRQLQQRGQTFGFVSNSGASPARVVHLLAAMGLQVDEATILTAAGAACDYVLETFGAGCRVFNAGNDTVDELLAGRVTLVEPDDAAGCQAVVIASLHHERAAAPRLQAALRHLLRGAQLVAMCNDRYFPTPRGVEIGSGGVAALLSYAAAVTPVFCGKPEAWFFLDLCRRLRVDPSRCVLIGDNLESDVAGARRVGIRTILPLTGVTDRPAAAAAAADRRPDWVIDDLRTLLR